MCQPNRPAWCPRCLLGSLTAPGVDPPSPAAVSVCSPWHCSGTGMQPEGEEGNFCRARGLGSTSRRRGKERQSSRRSGEVEWTAFLGPDLRLPHLLFRREKTGGDKPPTVSNRQRLCPTFLNPDLELPTVRTLPVSRAASHALVCLAAYRCLSHGHHWLSRHTHRTT